MRSSATSLSGFKDSKSHYAILDGLRGVAAIMVVIFHLFEAHAANSYEQIINHGYLAVDFFFLLSGFVIGYAYDDRWGQMSTAEFFKRRLIRLHPMIIMGMTIGAIFFYFQDSSLFPRIHEVPVSTMLMIMVIGYTLIPVPPSMDIRGWQEMHPLDGPAWSLFFEYVGNLLYALFVRRFSTWMLAALVLVSAYALIHLAVLGPRGDVIGGWSLEPAQFHIGFVRMMFPFFAGLLLSRVVKPGKIKQAFLLCSVMVVVSLSLPRFGGAEHHWMNGLYDSLTIIVVFPVIVYLGASGDAEGKWSSKLCHFFGHISYPLYITHYPLIYTYTAWVVHNKVPLQNAWPVAVGVLFSSVVLAYACLRLYDVPVRQWLAKKYMT